MFTALPLVDEYKLGLTIDQAYRRDEATLQETCWFDYRHLGPVARTYLYADYYIDRTRKFFALTQDSEKAGAVRGFTPDDIFASRDLIGMWNARRFADQHALPYWFVLSFMQERALSRLWNVMPRPNQCYGEDEVTLDLLPAWRAHMGATLVFAEHERFKAAAWAYEPDQYAYAQFVRDQVRRRPAPHFGLIARLLSEGVFSESMVVRFFSQAELAGALEHQARVGGSKS